MLRLAGLVLLLAAAAQPQRPLENFRLPSKSVFSEAMPRYPNAWFYLEDSLAPNYEAAVRLITGEVQKAMRLRQIPGPFSNPEGCDSDYRLEHLQPWLRSRKGFAAPDLFEKKLFASSARLR